MSDFDNKNPIRNIVILMAMYDEAKSIIDSLNLKETNANINQLLPMRCFQNIIGSINISLIISGVDERYNVDYVGSEAATLMAYEAVTKINPDLLISAGTAGGFSSKGAKIGTVYVSNERFVYHDRHVPIPGFCQSAIGNYPATKVSKLVKDLCLEQGIISTGSSLEKSEKDIFVINEYNAIAKEMEAAGVAWVAMLLKTPIIAIKSITNLLDKENLSEKEFIKNLSFASECLHKAIISVINYLQNKSLVDLK